MVIIIVKLFDSQPRRSVLPRHFPGISENTDGRFVVITVSYLKRKEKVSQVMTQVSVVKIVDVQRHYFQLAFNISSESSNQGASVKKLK